MINKRSTNVSYVIRLTVILAFFAVLIYPVALMVLDGPDMTEMESEATTELKELSWDTYLDGTFQSNFEAWFSAHYPLRSNVVTTYRQMRYDVENAKPVIGMMKLLSGDFAEEEPSVPTIKPPISSDTDNNPSAGDRKEPTDVDDPGTSDVPADPVEDDPWAIYLDPSNIYADINYAQLLEVPKEPTGYKGNNSVYIGKSGYLFESSYIEEYMGYSAPYNTVTREGVEETVEKLTYIQQELKKRGIELLYVLTSSKASAYADYIPEYYKNMKVAPEDYVRPVDMLREALAQSSVNYLDSAAYWQEIGLLNTFPKTGIHWNAPASFESTAKLIRMYQELSGETTVTLTAKGVIYHDDAPSSFNNEKDVYKILYGAIAPSNAIVDQAYYSPDVAVSNASAKKLNVLLQGGSFAGSINYYLEHYGVADVDYIYYNGLNTHGSISASSPWENGPEAWGYWLEGRDLVILESTEQQVRGVHYDGSKTWAQIAGDGNYGHNAVYDSLYEYLKNHEGEY